MSSNFYEDPNVIMNVRYSKGLREDRGQRVERQVDIYESEDNFTDHHVDVSRQTGGTCTQKHLPAVQRSPFKSAALVLGLLCLLLVVGVTVLSKFYSSIISEKHQLQTSYEKLQSRNDNLRNAYCQGKESQTQGNITTSWNRFGCSCYYESTERRNWTDSRRDCQSRDADLVIITSKDEHDFLRELRKHRDSWIGLQVTKPGWEKKLKWEWVDGSESTYWPWSVEVNSNPMDGLIGFIDQQGNLRHTNDGSKHWICERQLK